MSDYALNTSVEDQIRYWRERCLAAESSREWQRKQGDPVLVENERLAREHTQCHEQNNRLISEQFDLKTRIADLEDTEKIANNVRAELFCTVAVLRLSLGRAREYIRSLRALNAVTGPTVDIEIKRMADVLDQTR